jgi:hypothetical protein
MPSLKCLALLIFVAVFISAAEFIWQECHIAK